MVNLNSSREVAFIVMAVFLFFATNFSPPLLGVIYVLMIFAYAFVLENVFPEFPISIGKSKVEKIALFVMIGIAGWLFLSSIIFNYFGVATQISQPESIIGILAASTTPPIITENSFIYLFVFGFIIPIAETLFFLGFILPYVDKKMTHRNKYVDWLMAAIVTGAIVSLWHYTAHTFQDMALIADFIFFFISSLIVLEQRDLKIATFLHIIANSLIIMKTIGWF